MSYQKRSAGSVVPGSPLEASVRILLDGTHWLVVDGQSRGAEAVAAELRNVGCLAKLVDPEGRDVPQLGTFDAHVVLTDDQSDLRFLAERLGMNPGLRWASLLRMDWSELWTPERDVPAVGVLAARAAPLLQPDARLRHLARTGPMSLEPELDELGPVRTLRAIATSEHVFRVCFRTPHQEAHIELAGSLVLAASFQATGSPLVTGDAAFASALELESPRVRIERRSRPETLSLVSPLDEALARALTAVRERREADEGPTVRFFPPAITQAVAEAKAADSHVPREARPSKDEVRSSFALPSHRAPRDGLSGLWGSLSKLLPRRDPTPVQRWVALSALGFVSSVLLILWVSRLFLLLDPSGTPAAAMAPPEPVVVPAKPEPKPDQPKAPAPRATSRQSAQVRRSERKAEVAKQRAAHEDKPVAAPNEELENDPHALERLARKALKDGDTGRAVTYAARAVLLRKKRAAYRVLYGDALAADGQTERALEQYRIALEKDPDSRELRARIARLEMSPTS